MKKGFTMIELIFVIVILGILASVAIPRLAGTRADAEVATTVANLRTLLSDASAYYVAHGKFDVNWNNLTNVPLAGAATTAATTAANLKVGDTADCITVKAVAKAGNVPAHILFTKVGSPTGVCQEVLTADPVVAIVDNTVKYGAADDQKVEHAIAIGSTTSVY